MTLTRGFLLALLLALSGGPVAAQGTQIDFGGLKTDPSAPVEVTADSLKVDQADGTAVFSGNVLVGQGKMRLGAATLKVDYAKGTEGAKGRIQTLHASGGVTLVTSPTEAAKSDSAVYSVDTGIVVMTGNVLLTQGQNVLSGQKLTVNLQSGTGRMEGRVRTTLQPAQGAKSP